MKIETINRIEDIEKFAGEWNALLPHGASHVPFLTPEYVAAWWQYLGGGEWDQGELCIIVVHDDRGEMVGIAPLFLTGNPDGEPALMFIGSIEIADFLDFVVRPDDLDPFLAALLEHLDGPHAPSWKRLDLYNILDESPTLPALQSAAENFGWVHHQEQIQPAPYINLPGDWTTYMDALDKKHRHELRRKMRRAANYVIPVTWYFLEDESDLEAELDTFFHLMSQEPEKDRFLTERMQAQIRAIARAALRGGWLQMAILKVGHDKSVVQMNFDYAGRIWGYNSGVGMDHRDLSPGLVLNGHLIEWAIQNGRTAWDFMRGDEEYKYRFGAQDRHVIRATLTKE